MHTQLPVPTRAGTIKDLHNNSGEVLGLFKAKEFWVLCIRSSSIKKFHHENST